MPLRCWAVATHGITTASAAATATAAKTAAAAFPAATATIAALLLLRATATIALLLLLLFLHCCYCYYCCTAALLLLLLLQQSTTTASTATANDACHALSMYDPALEPGSAMPDHSCAGNAPVGAKVCEQKTPNHARASNAGLALVLIAIRLLQPLP